MRGFFVTGTDTGVGKTFVSVALVHALRAKGFRVLAMKPVASGCERTAGGWRNSDALQLQHAASQVVPYQAINPYAFEPPIAPHLAAQQAGLTIHLPSIAAGAERLASECDWLVVEGAGGWRVPLNDHETIPDLARQLGLPIVLVVGMRLGCINHALLTAESIERAGLPFAGWIANFVDPQMIAATETLSDLQRRITAPFLGAIPHRPKSATPSIASLHLESLVTSPRSP